MFFLCVRTLRVIARNQVKLHCARLCPNFISTLWTRFVWLVVLLLQDLVDRMLKVITCWVWLHALSKNMCTTQKCVQTPPTTPTSHLTMSHVGLAYFHNLPSYDSSLSITPRWLRTAVSRATIWWIDRLMTLSLHLSVSPSVTVSYSSPLLHAFVQFHWIPEHFPEYNGFRKTQIHTSHM